MQVAATDIRFIITDLPMARVLSDAQDFKSATSGVHAKTMRNELNKLVGTVQDPGTRKVSSSILAHGLSHSSQAFDIEMQSFFYLFTRYLVEKSRNEPM